MASVPRAVATGSQFTPWSSLSERSPVATALGTDFITKIEFAGWLKGDVRV